MDPKSYRDVQAYAKKTGEILSNAILKFGDVENLGEDELSNLLDIALQANHEDVSAVAAKVQKHLYNSAGIGANPLIPEYDHMTAKSIVESLNYGSETINNIVNVIIKESLKVSDDSIQKNSKAASNMGLKTRIVRKYDEIGLRRGTRNAEPCQWCLEREGEWDNYADAAADGAFERHPGCGCYIGYEVGKTRTWSTSAGKWVDM